MITFLSEINTLFGKELNRLKTSMFHKIPLFFIYRYVGFFFKPLLPINYTFSLTYRCNSHCRTCNIWRKKVTRELSVDDWRRIFLSLGHSPYWVTLSGGELFIRRDLTDIVSSLCNICHPKVITIPTNGLLREKILKNVREIINNFPKTHFIINLSLDGIGKEHDKARGIAGNYEKALGTFRALKEIESDNLTLGIHTVISNHNVNSFAQLANFILSELKPDSYVTEVAENRVELDNLNEKIVPSFQDYKKTVEFLKKKILSQKMDFFGRITRAFRLVYYDLVIETMQTKRQVIPCYAGIVSVQIAPNGDVWPCCVRAEVLGNLKENNFDFKSIWFSKKASNFRQSVRSKACYCPLANVSYTNILLNPKKICKVLLNCF